MIHKSIAYLLCKKQKFPRGILKKKIIDTSGIAVIEFALLLPFFMILIAGFWFYTEYQLKRAILDDTAYSLVNLVKENPSTIDVAQLKGLLTNTLLKGRTVNPADVQLGLNVKGVNDPAEDIPCEAYTPPAGLTPEVAVVCLSYPMFSEDLLGMNLHRFTIRTQAVMYIRK